MIVAGWIPAARGGPYATTEPRGIHTVKIPGVNAPATTARTYLGIQLLEKTRFVGSVASVSGNQLSFQGLGDHTQIADGDGESYLHVLTGAGRGFVADIHGYQTTNIVCSEDVSGWIQPGDRIRIRPHPTLEDLFGSDNKFGLGSGDGADISDDIVVWDPVTQTERVYYFHSVRSRWEEKNLVADAGGDLIRFPHGFYLVRRSSGTLRISMSGEVGSDAVLLPVRPGANVFSLPVNLTGSLDALVRSSGNHAVLSGANSASADLLALEEPSTGLRRGPFYHLSRGSEQGWREIGIDGSVLATQSLDFLSTLILMRGGAAGYVFVDGSLAPPASPRPPLPPDPEEGEAALQGELPLPDVLPPAFSMVVETSVDLQNWSYHADPQIEPGRVVFTLPSGQTRSFYRLKIVPEF